MNEIATFAGGCFWCTEALFKRLKGVVSVVPGYTGGTVPNPTYEDVCEGTTGHAEAIQITFDPMQIPYEKLLEIFFHTHNPTTPNQQGNDVGPQYRSAIFYHSEEQKNSAKKIIEEIKKEKVYEGPIVTEVVPFTVFYEAENYHKNYFDNNDTAPYCNVIISPKIHKLLNLYGNEVKEEYKKESH
jgi:peptide-methionine (S)-S-oxide reductase